MPDQPSLVVVEWHGEPFAVLLTDADEGDSGAGGRRCCGEPGRGRRAAARSRPLPHHPGARAGGRRRRRAHEADELSVQTLASRTGCSLANASQHLNRLAREASSTGGAWGRTSSTASRTSASATLRDRLLRRARACRAPAPVIHRQRSAIPTMPRPGTRRNDRDATE
jgi:hypothetical protein